MKPKTKIEIDNIRKSGSMLAAVLKMIKKELKPGLTGLDIDRMARAELKKLGGEPAFFRCSSWPRDTRFPCNDMYIY